MGGGEQTRTYKFSGRNSDDSTNVWPLIFKAIELILCALCIFLFDDPANNFNVRLFVNQRIICLCFGTFVTYLIFSIIYLIGKFIRDEWPWKTTVILAGIATILFFVCGSLLIRDYTNIKYHSVRAIVDADERGPSKMSISLLLVSGILSIVTSVTFLVDALLTFWIARK